jgi:transcriptional regulator with XRE-family HTH domain
MVNMLGAHETRLMDEHRKAFGSGLRRARNNARLTQEQLAESSGISQAAISKIERGAQEATTSVMEALAVGLGMQVSAIWREAEGGRGEATSVKTRQPAAKRKHIDIDIDALRINVGAIAVGLAKVSQAAGKQIVRELENPEIPSAYLEKEGSVFLLKQAVEVALRQAKANKRPR